MQEFVNESSVSRDDVPIRAQYARSSAARTAVLALGLILAAGGLVWVTLGRPQRDVGAPGEYDIPPPVGAPLRAQRPVVTDGSAGGAARASPATEIKTEADGDYARVEFDALAGFEYDPYLMLDAPTDDGKPPEQIPKTVKALDGRRLAVQGFMVPVQMVKENVRYFLLVRNQLMCCFGVAVGMNEWIYITMAEGSNARYTQDVPVMVYGTLHVGEEIRDGMVMSIYRMDGEKLVVKGGY